MSAKEKKPVKEKGEGKAAGKTTGKKSLPIIQILLVGVAGLAALPVTFLIVPGLLPTAIMALTDRNPKRNLTVSVGVLNLTSVLYVVSQMVASGYGIDYALRLLMQPLTWGLMWAGAAIGLALHHVIPPVVAQVLAGFAEIRIKKLRTNQEMLKKDWSDDVKG